MTNSIQSSVQDSQSTTSKKKKSSRFSSNSEASASELLENLEGLRKNVFKSDVRAP